MKKWQIVIILLLISGMTAGCFSPAEDQQQSNSSQESAKKEPLPEQKPALPDDLPQGTDNSSSASSDLSNGKNQQNKALDPAAGSDATKNEQTPPSGGIAPPQTTAPTMTVEQVSGKYKKELTSLRGYYAGQLQALYSGALTDMKANQDSKQAIFAKYSKRARMIQEESQAKVNQVLAKMKEELIVHQLPTGKVNEYRSTYYSELDDAKNKAMSQVKKALGM